MLSLPLGSLSTAQDADADQQKFTWQKETHDLTFVIDSYGGRDNNQLIKIVQGTRVREGEELIRQMQGRGVQMQADQLPISAIVRTPLLAIRWQLPSHKVRRIQVKFKSDKDFDTAFNRLHQIGLRMSEHGSTSNPSRGPAPTPSAQPGQKAATSPEQPASSTAIGSSLSCPPSRLAEISSRPHTAFDAPAPFKPQLHEAAHSRPSSALFGSNRGDAFISASFSGPLNPPVVFPRPPSATADILGPNYNNASSPKQHISTVEVAPPVFTDRPETAMLLDRPGTSEMLPPRRELPFQRLSSSGSDTGRSSDRPLTGTMGPPALPRSAVQRPGSSRSSRTKDIELPPLPQPTVINKSDSEMQQTPRTPNQDPCSFQRIKTSPAIRLENEPLFSALSSFPLTSKESSPPALTSPQTHNMPGSKAENLQGSMLEHRHHSLAIPGASHPILNAPGASSSTIGTDDADRLAAYATQTDEGRRAALNEFIFRHLENEDFLILVEDMETAWARVALGMR
ncbi:uncharacterized protein yc1106_08863 [Curvularia clavata]|uniref:Uncharacterized protein n=1 Tax=Curvularia clavata TaxID=95742 RepID=A0A9Q8ZHI1_CURCL|nr:uncharacterized protein yc1106_08863 [Curvularia clavata]